MHHISLIKNSSGSLLIILKIFMYILCCKKLPLGDLIFRKGVNIGSKNGKV